MTSLGGDTFLEMRRVWTCDEHPFVMIALEHNGSASAESTRSTAGNDTGIGCHTAGVSGFGHDLVSDRAAAVMTCEKGRYGCAVKLHREEWGVRNHA